MRTESPLRGSLSFGWRESTSAAHEASKNDVRRDGYRERRERAASRAGGEERDCSRRPCGDPRGVEASKSSGSVVEVRNDGLAARAATAPSGIIQALVSARPKNTAEALPRADRV